MADDLSAMRIAVTGATGYVGGRLVPELLEAGAEVVCIVRSATKLVGRAWADHPRVQIFECDVSDVPALTRRLSGCHSAYYMVHSMAASGPEYAARDRDLARGFAQAASAADLERIIYLGGLGETGPDLSQHLSSRREVEHLLSEGGVPVTVLRAAMVIGSGSASFEILRHLVARLPVMVTPRWVDTRVQPIGIDDTLRYLVDAVRRPATTA